ncbi:hypothetical protein Tco_0980896 [Tanacetum coccineum]
MDPTSQSGLSHIYPLIASTQKWGILEVPCKHAIAEIHDMADNGTWHNKRGCPTKLAGSSEAAQRGSVPSETMPSQHMSSQPVPNKPVPSQLVPCQPIPSQLVPSQHVPSQLMPSQHVPS